MNRNKAASFIPAAARASEATEEFWGRLTALTPQDAEFVANFEVPAGRTLLMDFELGGAAFSEVTARVTAALRDPDGYFNYSLRFTAAAQRELLKSAIEKLTPA